MKQLSIFKKGKDGVSYPPAIVVVIVVLAVVGVGIYFALESGPKAKFEVTSLTISPAEAKVGQTVTVSAAVKNTGNATGNHRVALTIDGEEVEAEEVTLAVGETKTVTFTIMKDTEGIFTIGAGGLTKSLEVRALIPAEFEISNLIFNPSEAEVGNPVVVSATVNNVGDLEGTYTVELKIDGVIEATQNVTLAGGAAETVSFTVTNDTPGTHTIDVGGLKHTLNVSKPATFEVSIFKIYTSGPYSEFVAGQGFTVVVKVKNVGESEGTYTARLNVDGILKRIKDVTVAGGETEEVYLTTTVDTPGAHIIEIDGVTEEVNFLRPPTPEVSNISIYPSKVPLGSFIEIRYTVKNVGDVDGTVKIPYRKDNEKNFLSEWLEAGESKKVTRYIVDTDEVRTHEIEIAGVKKTIEVVKAPYILVWISYDWEGGEYPSQGYLEGAFNVVSCELADVPRGMEIEETEQIIHNNRTATRYAFKTKEYRGGRHSWSLYFFKNEFITEEDNFFSVSAGAKNITSSYCYKLMVTVNVVDENGKWAGQDSGVTSEPHGWVSVGESFGVW